MKQMNNYRERQERHNHFVNRWVHQIKTPVSIIDLLTQQPGETSLPESGRQLLASIREENERIADGLELMLQTARLDRFELDLRPASVSLVRLARNAVNRHKKALIRSAVFPKIEAPDPGLTVDTDEKWLGVVLDQLLTNAVKYSKGVPGDKTLLLAAEPTPEGARLRITDKGIGIPPEDLPRVFDAFFTGENGRAGSESTGMGLFLAREICRGLGHRISIESAPGAGTTVTIDFATRSLHRKVTG
jgi:signal transduction histidine kinase